MSLSGITAYRFAYCGEETRGNQKSTSGDREKERIRDVARIEKRKGSGGGVGAFGSCFTRSAIVVARASSGPEAGDSKRKGSRVPRQSRASQVCEESWQRLKHSYEAHHVVPDFVYDPTLAKKILGRTEPTTLSERLKDCDDMPYQHMRNEDLSEEASMGPKGALDQYLFRNVPEATMQLGQERHRREVCSSKLQEIERDLQEFSEAFGNKLLELKKSMGEFAQSMKELMHYDEGNYIEDRLWEEADTNSKAVDIVTPSQSPPHR